MYYKVCKHCGYNYQDFLNSGLLGCPRCYESFSRELMPSIQKLHSGLYHTGKQPACSGIDKQLMDEYKRLLSEKQSAVLEGRFSDMAELSLQLEALAEELKKRGLV